ncbi:M20/M25/M40 family metallo-hydrolase [Halobacteriaceae archaeon GCM10025711]
MRSYDDAVVKRAVERVEHEVESACEREGTSSEFEVLWRVPHTEFAPRVREAVAAAAEETDVSHERLVSGAGHDATYLNAVTDAGMVFVPSVGGTTHSEDEFTEWDDVVAGARTYANAVLELATD